MTELKITVPANKQTSYTIKVGVEILYTLWSHIEDQFFDRIKFIITYDNLVCAGHLQALVSRRFLASCGYLHRCCNFENNG
jgi:hypothetical protein